MKTRLPTETWRTLRTSGLPVLDVRSEGEFALGAVPGAASLPLFSNAERHQIGWTYKQVGRLEATQLGVEAFAAKSVAYIDAIERLVGGQRELIVQCWRGGMRSQAVAMWLRSMGFRPVVVRGGYKAFRNEVLAALDELGGRDLLVLDGRTGVGKSDLLKRLRGEVPLLDFEGLARHRGSAFGDFAQEAPVPTQQNFENTLADAYLGLPTTGRILVEIETFLGKLYLPLKLRERITSSPAVLLSRDLEDRIARITAEYAQAWDEKADALFVERLELLRRHMGGADLAAIAAFVKARDFGAAVRLLLERRYDKVYDKGLARREHQVVARFNLTQEEEAAVTFLKAQFSKPSANQMTNR